MGCGVADGVTKISKFSTTVAAKVIKVGACVFAPTCGSVTLAALAFLGGYLGLVGMAEVEACFNFF